MRNLILACLTALAAIVPSIAFAVAPPAVYGTDKIEPGRQAFIDSQVAAFNGKTASDPEATLLSLIAVDPGNTRYFQALAAFADKSRDYGFLVDILTALPENGTAAWALAEKLSDGGYNALALPYYRIASDVAVSDHNIQKKAGLNAYFAGDYSACVTYYDRSGKIYALLADDYVKRGECHAFLGHVPEAQGDFGSAAAMDGRTAWGYGARMVKDGVFDSCKGSAAGKTETARKLFGKNKDYEAYRDVHIALQCDPSYVPALELRVEIEKADYNLRYHAAAHAKVLDNLRDGGQTNDRDGEVLRPRTARQLLKDASMIDMLLSRRNVATVAYLASRALELEPDNWKAYHYSARALLNLQDERLYPLTWQAVTRADVAEGPTELDRAILHHVRGQLYFRAEMWTPALDEYNAALALTPNDMRFYIMRGVLLLKLDEPDRAMKDFDFVLQYEPKNAKALAERSRIHYRRKAWAAARADLERLYAIQPDNDDVRGEIIRMLDFEGRTAEANARHKQFLVDDPAGANGIPYLARRATSTLQAQAGADRDRKAQDDAHQAAIRAWQEAADSYKAAGAAKDAAIDYMERLTSSGQTLSLSTQGPEVVRMMDAAIKKYSDTMKLVSRLKASDHMRYLHPEEVSDLDVIEESCSKWIDELLAVRTRLSY